MNDDEDMTAAASLTTSVELSDSQVAAWLDAHPEFLKPYLTKRVKRRSSMFNEHQNEQQQQQQQHQLDLFNKHYSTSDDEAIAHSSSPAWASTHSYMPVSSSNNNNNNNGTASTAPSCKKPLVSATTSLELMSSTPRGDAQTLASHAPVALNTSSPASSSTHNMYNHSHHSAVASSSSTAGGTHNNTSSSHYHHPPAHALNDIFASNLNASLSLPSIIPPASSPFHHHHHHYHHNFEHQSNEPTDACAHMNFKLASPGTNMATGSKSKKSSGRHNHNHHYHHNSQSVSRNSFKQLSLYEKMFTIVKTIYQSLDLKITCKKILNTVSLLLDADRCSLFLVVDDEQHTHQADAASQSWEGSDGKRKCLISVIFDSKSSSSSSTKASSPSSPHTNAKTPASNAEQTATQDPSSSSSSSASSSPSASPSLSSSSTHVDHSTCQIKIPYGDGIAGWVAASGVPLNIPDAYKDPRFNPSIDQQTGYRTRSILCLPILNEKGQCVAVAEALNKINDDNDENRQQQQQQQKQQQSSTGDGAAPSTFFTKEDEEIFAKFMPFIAIAIRNTTLYSQSRKEAQTNKVLLELATIVFDESSSTLDNLVSRILFNSLFLLECESCKVVLLNNSNSHQLNRTRRLSYASINKYFDRTYELNYDDLMSNPTLSAAQFLVKPKATNLTSTSPELEIINAVINSNNILNVSNWNEDPKYANLFKNSKTRSLLCIPVINSNDQLVALIFATNKMKNSSLSNRFSQSDINIAQAFALFCGIGIQNIMMYEKVVRAMNMQQVALDVLSYHASSSQDEVDRFLQEKIPLPNEIGLFSFDFDENTLDDIGTIKASISMFADLGLIEKFDIPYEVLCRFFLTVKKNYRPVAYHNWRHGFNVMSCMFTILTTGKYREMFSDLEVLSLMIACVCHDLDHRGTTNTFQMKIQSPLAKLYSTSTMEHHHFNQCIIILHNNPNNILMNLNQTEHSTAIDLIEKAILATDLTIHFKHIDKFLTKANSSNKAFVKNDEKDLLQNMLMTACDLSGGAKPWKCHYRMANLVSNEFFNEGDLEKEKFKREPIDSMNRDKSDQMPKMQIQFLQSVCWPLYNGLSLCNTNLKPLSERCQENIKEWQKLVKI